MTKKGWMAAGLTVGLIAGSCVSAFAAEGLKYVQASINDTFKFQVNGEEKALDDEYTVLAYKDRTYLPVRGIGELMGADIDWNDETKTIVIDTTTINQTPETDNPSVPSDDSTETKVEYKKLPQTYEDTNYRVTVTSCSKAIGTEKLTRIYFRITNLSGKSICVLPARIVISADGKTFSKYTTDVDMNNQDQRLYSKVLTDEDEELSSYITLPDSIKNATKIHLEIPVELSEFDGNKVNVLAFDLDTEAK